MNAQDPDNLFYAYVLTQSEFLLPREVIQLIEKCGTAREVFYAPPRLYQHIGVSASRLTKIKDLAKNLSIYEKSFEQLSRQHIEILHYDDPRFPEKLKHIVGCPYLLFYRGELPDFQTEHFLAVVGTRQATEYARLALHQFIPELCRAKIQIVSGLAFGVDVWAHELSVHYPHQSVAILAKGVDCATPSAQQNLFEQLVDAGCVMSEFAFAQSVHARHFPRRNRIVSGLSSGVFVVEAPEKSGALITAHYALEQNRNVYALPASITQKNSLGCLKLIQEGAKLVCTAQDILDDFNIQTHAKPISLDLPLLSSFSADVLNFCKTQPKQKEEIYFHFYERKESLSSVLSELELEGWLTQRDGYFVCMK